MAKKEKSSGVSPRRLEGVRVLLLEDEALVNMMLTEVMTDAGCSVMSCYDLEECHACIERAAPDIGVLDVNVHGAMSFDLAKRLSELAVPVIFLTGYDTPDRDGVLKRHLTLQKPCAPDALIEGIAKLLAR